MKMQPKRRKVGAGLQLLNKTRIVFYTRARKAFWGLQREIEFDVAVSETVFKTACRNEISTQREFAASVETFGKPRNRRYTSFDKVDVMHQGQQQGQWYSAALWRTWEQNCWDRSTRKIICPIIAVPRTDINRVQQVKPISSKMNR